MCDDDSIFANVTQGQFSAALVCISGIEAQMIYAQPVSYEMHFWLVKPP
jgi:hypothetical protein